MHDPQSPEKRAVVRRPDRATALTALLVVQIVCVVFFMIDVTLDLLGWEGLMNETGHHYFELAIVAALIFSTAATLVDMRWLRARQRRMEAQLRVASGAFTELLEEYFDTWSLTPSERDVALLSIKGLSIAEIAQVRQTKEGTVKAQCNAIYSKAGVSGRQQLLSLFIEELMAGSVIPEPSPG